MFHFIVVKQDLQDLDQVVLLKYLIFDNNFCRINVMFFYLTPREDAEKFLMNLSELVVTMSSA